VAPVATCAQTVETTSRGACSPNIVENKGEVDFTCQVKLDSEAAKKLNEILNEAVAQARASQDEDAKLDEILRFIRQQMPRRLTDGQKADLSTCLRKKPGSFSIGALDGNSESYRYAQDWRDVFLNAGWKIEHTDIPIQLFMIGGVMWSGVQFSVHDGSLDPNSYALVTDSPEGNLWSCLSSRSDLPGGGRFVPYKDKPSGSVAIEVSDRPQP
jgi:hypothetical protein